MYFYNINSIEDLTVEKIQSIIKDFQGRIQPILNTRDNYYKGNQKIKNKQYSDPSKPCTKAVINYCKNIVENYGGYLNGKPITYSSNEDISDIQDCLKYNDVKREDSLLLRNALIYGVSYEVVYIGEDKQIRFKNLDSRYCIPIFDNSLDENLIAVIRFWRVDNLDENKGYYVEIYTDNDISTYTSDTALNSLTLIANQVHYFKQVPIIIYRINGDYDNIFDCIVDLQDSYNNLYSAEIDDYQAFVDAYLLLKGANIDVNNEEDKQTLANMKENRIMLLDTESNAEYLTKNFNDAQIQNLLKDTNDAIHKISNSPDFNDQKFLSASGISLRYKLVGFENCASNIESYIKEGLQKRIELISTILTLSQADISVWRDINIVFTRNLPENILDIVSTISSLRGLVSDETLLSWLPLIPDAKAELEKLNAEKPKVEYFTTDDTDTDDADISGDED